MAFTNIFSTLADYEWLNIDNDSNGSYIKFEVRNGQTDQNYSYQYDWGDDDYEYFSEY